jgi:histone acetyltransferase (RNA polymerase elongator complex component)
MLIDPGPIRPPSEANSYLIRVTRNCPWNKCLFCPVYKKDRYEPRPVEDILAEIDYDAHTLGNRFKSAFLQDANPIQAPTPDLIKIISTIKNAFPSIKTVTTYSRSSTLKKKSIAELEELRAAGLTRIHCGLESGYDALLRYMKKGSNAKILIEGGQKVKQAGLELCHYVMPGLGGDLQLEGHPTWKRHAEETARVINEVNPDYVRLRTLGVHPATPLGEKVSCGEFRRLTDPEIVEEIRYFIERLDGVTSRIESDHSLNLLMELKGTLPDDKERMLSIIDTYLQLPLIDKYGFRLWSSLFRYNLVSEFTLTEAEYMRDFMHEKLGIDPDRDLNPTDIQNLEHVVEVLLSQRI